LIAEDDVLGEREKSVGFGELGSEGFDIRHVLG
jgi:hypothetical protein